MVGVCSPELLLQLHVIHSLMDATEMVTQDSITIVFSRERM